MPKIEIPNDKRVCKISRRHFLFPTDTSDKYEEFYELVIHEICACCTTLRHMLCHADGTPASASPYRYEHPDGYREIEVTRESKAAYNLERYETARKGWQEKAQKVRRRKAPAQARELVNA